MSAACTTESFAPCTRAGLAPGDPAGARCCDGALPRGGVVPCFVVPRAFLPLVRRGGHLVLGHPSLCERRILLRVGVVVVAEMACAVRAELPAGGAAAAPCAAEVDGPGAVVAGGATAMRRADSRCCCCCCWCGGRCGSCAIGVVPAHGWALRIDQPRRAHEAKGRLLTRSFHKDAIVAKWAPSMPWPTQSGSEKDARGPQRDIRRL